MIRLEENGLVYLQFESFQKFPLFHGIFTRHGGVSRASYQSLNTGGTVGDDPQAVLENHKRIYRTAGFDFSSRFDVWQVHGNKILKTDAPRPVDVPHPKADGIITDHPDVTLFMRFADCVPLLMFDPLHHAIGIIHAGWQGTCKKIAQAGVEAMVSAFNSDPAHLLVGIGPSICSSCYEVGEDVRQAFEESFGPAWINYFQKVEKRWHLDLWRVNANVLREAGVRHIETAKICTACHLDDWYSHRAEKGRTGRFAVLMGLRLTT
jgi:polyphenol oxidase